MAKLKLTTDFDENVLIYNILKELTKKINSVLFSLKNDGILKSQVYDFIDRQIRNSPEFSSLLNGELREVFGLEDSSNAVETVINVVKSSSLIEIQEAKIISKNIVGANIKISILIDNFQDILSTEQASYKSKNGEVKWLDWLLTKGDSIILANYALETDIFSQSSRTGNTLMIKSNTGFRVPPEYAGNVRDNWLTRCFDETEEIVGNIIRVELIRRF